jgi:glycosyltransferase involved in cell wall biosynthesis
MGDHRLSVALVTRNRAESLQRTLESLRAQDVQPWEVVVSDDSDDEVASAVESLARDFDCRYVRGLRRGLYANRNRAARACRGTHIRTIDDDHEFPRGHFRECLRAIRADPRAIWIIGEFVPGEEFRPPPHCPAQLHPRGFSVTPPDPDRCWALADGASIFPREVFDRGNCYVEFFVFGASYLEFGSRLYWLGYHIRFLAETYVVHHFDASNRSYADQEIDIGSRVFSTLCHSFIYQPTFHNKTLTLLQMGRELLVHRGRALRSIRCGLRSYVEHRSTVVGVVGAPGRTTLSA